MATIQQAPAPAIRYGTSLWALAAGRMCQNRLTVACAAVLGVLVIACALALWIAPYSYQEIDLKLGATPPSRAHLMGTDTLGRDMFSRCLYGGQISIAVGMVGTLVSLIIGVMYGALAGYSGGRLDELMMRFVD